MLRLLILTISLGFLFHCSNPNDLKNSQSAKAYEYEILEQKDIPKAELQMFKVERVLPPELPFFDDNKPEGQRWNIERMNEELEGQKLFPVRRFNVDGVQYISSYVITTSQRPILEAKHIKHAYAENLNRASLLVELTAEGEAINRDFTRNRMVKGRDQVAFIVDGVALTVPVQMADELGAHFQISGMKDFHEALSISTALTPSRTVELTIQLKTTDPPEKDRLLATAETIHSSLNKPQLVVQMLYSYSKDQHPVPYASVDFTKNQKGKLYLHNHHP